MVTSEIVLGGPSISDRLETIASIEREAGPQYNHPPASPGSGAVPLKWRALPVVPESTSCSLERCQGGKERAECGFWDP